MDFDGAGEKRFEDEGEMVMGFVGIGGGSDSEQRTWQRKI